MPNFFQLARRCGLAALTMFLFAAACAAQQQPTAKARPTPPKPAAARVTKTTLGAVVPRGKPCPLTVDFRGTITTNGPTEVKYTWVSFDGGTWPEHTIRFGKAGMEKVEEKREVSATGGGWMQLKVLSPNPALSNRASYRVSCGKGK